MVDGRPLEHTIAFVVKKGDMWWHGVLFEASLWEQLINHFISCKENDDYAFCVHGFSAYILGFGILIIFIKNKHNHSIFVW